MKRFARMLATMALASTAALGAEPVKTPALITTLNVQVEDARPIAAAILELETRHGVAITYEDPAFAHVGDVADVTEAVRRDLAKYAQGAAPRVIVPRAGALNFSYEADRATGKPVNMGATMAAMFASQQDGANPGAFSAVEQGGVTHVVPAFVKDEAGVTKAVTPVLDHVGGMPAVQANGIEALTALCEAISGASGSMVVVGTIPANLFGNSSVVLPGGESSGREALMGLLSQLPATCSWQLLYDPGMKFYALNVHVIE